MNSLQQEEMFNEITEFFGYNINSRTRKREVIDIRHCWRVAMRDMGYTTTAIGSMTGHDHATILNSEKVVADLSKVNKDFRALYNGMRSFLKDFHYRNDISLTMKIEDRTNTIMSLYVDLLDYMSDNMEPEELEQWVSAAGLSMEHYQSILKSLQTEEGA